MTDGTRLNPGVGGDLILTEDTGNPNGKLPVSKIRLGAQDTDGGDVTITNPFPVVLCGSPEPLYGQKVIASTGTAVRLTTVSAPLAGALQLKALAGNSESIYVGGAAVTSSNGFELVPGEATEMSISDLSFVWFNGTAADGICWLGGGIPIPTGQLVNSKETIFGIGTMKQPGAGAFTDPHETLAATGTQTEIGAGSLTDPAETLVGVGSSFTPLSLSPTGWWRSDLGISTSGSTITQWADQSGNGYTLIPQNVAPLWEASGGANNLPYTYWTTDADAVMQMICTTFPVLNQPIDVFLVVRSPPTESATTSYYLLDFGGGNNNVTYCDAGSPIQLRQYNAVAFGEYGTLAPNTDFVLESQLNDPNSQGLINNVLTGSPSSIGSRATTGGISVGSYYPYLAGYCWAGFIYEVLVFDYLLNSTQRTELLNYFSTRYGI
jgi:hypothetical protein